MVLDGLFAYRTPQRGKFSPLSLLWLLPTVLVLSSLTASHPRHPYAVLGLAIGAVIGTTPLLFSDRVPQWLLGAGLSGVALTGAALYLIAPAGLTIILPFIATGFAVRRASGLTALVVLVVAVTSSVAVLIAKRDDLLGLLTLLTTFLAVVLGGIARRNREGRVEQTELALAREQTAREEHARAAALAERARIARDVHDVLAHSLAGLSLSLQGARLILERDGASPEAVAQVERAQRLAAEGLAEARRAVAALREDPVPVERSVADLVTAFRLETGAPAELSVRGDPRELPGPVATTVYRTAQEALTNTRKHAPGAPVRVTLDYQPDRVLLTVTDHPGRRPTPAAPGGYGLTGMRERAELIGGELTSEPGEDGWRVCLVVPT